MKELLAIQVKDSKDFLVLEVEERFNAKKINNVSEFLKGKHTIQYHSIKHMIDFYADNTHMYSLLTVRYNSGIIQGYSMPSQSENN